MGMVGSIILIKLVDLTIGVRVAREDEVVGLDLSQHGEEGYNLDLDIVPSALAGAGPAEPMFSAAPGIVSE